MDREPGLSGQEKIFKYLRWAWGLGELEEIQYDWGLGSCGEQTDIRLGRQVKTAYHEYLMCMDFILEVTGSC